MTESVAGTNGMKMAAILLLMTGCLALALDGFHYTESHAGNMGSLELTADMSRQIVVPIWVGLGALMLGGVLLMVSMNKINPGRIRATTFVTTHLYKEPLMRKQQTPRNPAREQAKATAVKQRKPVILRTKDEVARQENEGGPPGLRTQTG